MDKIKIVIIDGELSLYHNSYRFVNDEYGYRDEKHQGEDHIIEYPSFGSGWTCHTCEEFYADWAVAEYADAVWEFEKTKEPRLFYLEVWMEGDLEPGGWEVYDTHSVSNSKEELVAKATELLLNDTKINLRVIELVWEN
jgi:hypothetical protein